VCSSDLGITVFWSSDILHSPDNSRISFDLADESATIAFAQRLATQLQPGLVIYLQGNLGAGKTTLVRGVLRALGYDGRVKSPTYTLLETYQIATLNLCHFDLYRMNHDEEWESAGFRDEFNGRNIFFIEWPNKAENLLPPCDLEITLAILPHGRSVEVRSFSTLGHRCLESL
jgi:tRNA threonylcarbamoyladenosine biosynthesis protein TsaE